MAFELGDESRGVATHQRLIDREVAADFVRDALRDESALETLPDSRRRAVTPVYAAGRNVQQHKPFVARRGMYIRRDAMLLFRSGFALPPRCPKDAADLPIRHGYRLRGAFDFLNPGTAAILEGCFEVAGYP